MLSLVKSEIPTCSRIPDKYTIIHCNILSDHWNLFNLIFIMFLYTHSLPTYAVRDKYINGKVINNCLSFSGLFSVLNNLKSGLKWLINSCHEKENKFLYVFIQN